MAQLYPDENGWQWQALAAATDGDQLLSNVAMLMAATEWFCRLRLLMDDKEAKREEVKSASGESAPLLRP